LVAESHSAEEVFRAVPGVHVGGDGVGVWVYVPGYVVDTHAVSYSHYAITKKILS
jgi:hypothetical protein